MSAARGLRMQDGQKNKVLEFDRFSVDLDAALLRSEGRVVGTEPQVFEPSFLCTNPGRLIGYDEIIDKVWNGRIVSDAAIATRINAARKALGDDGTAQRVIKTVRGRGLRFQLEPVSRSIEPKAYPSASDAGNSDAVPKSHLDGPSIAVLPFDNMSPDTEQEYFADGIVEDIITGLSRVRSSSSSRATPPSPTRAGRSTSARLGASWACATCWKGACEGQAAGFA